MIPWWISTAGCADEGAASSDIVQRDQVMSPACDFHLGETLFNVFTLVHLGWVSPEEVTWFCQWTTWKLPHFQNSSTGYKAGILKSFSQCLLHPAKHYAGAQKSLRAFYLFLSDVYFLPLLQAFILTSHTKSPLLTNGWQHPFINFLLFASVSFP